MTATPTPTVTPIRDAIALVPTLARTSRVAAGRAPLRVTCPATELGGCRGSVRLRTARAVVLGGVRGVLELGEARYALRPGASATLRVRLARGFARLARRNRLAARADIATTDAAGNRASATRAVTLSLPARR